MDILNFDYLKIDNQSKLLIFTNIAIAKVEINPPMNPSIVFFGDNSISYVRPNNLPNT